MRRRKKRNLAKGETVHEIAHSNAKSESTIYRHEASEVKAAEMPANEFGIIGTGYKLVQAKAYDLYSTGSVYLTTVIADSFLD
jgi:hypothetical protein